MENNNTVFDQVIKKYYFLILIPFFASVISFKVQADEYINIAPILSELLLVATVPKSVNYLAAGTNHNCARFNDGMVKCWGDNSYGQLGIDTSTSKSATPVSVTSIENVAEISAGGLFSCVRIHDGSVKCWGINNGFKLGNNTVFSSSIPLTVSGLDNVAQISSGSGHNCALMTNNFVKCWGGNFQGQLGNGTNLSSHKPVYVIGIHDAIEVASGGTHSCARLTTGFVKCWGNNLFGQLGNGTTEDSSIPVIVTGINNAIDVSVGNSHSCALLVGGSVKCWGRNDFGQLGNGPLANSFSSVPVNVVGINNAQKISSTDANQTYAHLSDGTLKGWGYNSNGQLGTGNTLNSTIPVLIPGISSSVEVKTGPYHTCVRINDNTIKCWGENVNGELGNGTKVDSLVPVDVISL